MPKAKECRRILASGARCHALAIKGTPYCYFHQALRSFDQENRNRYKSIVVPKLEDRAAIQITLMSVLDAIGASKIDPVRGRLYLYGLKLAMDNLGANNNQLAVNDSVSNPVCPDGGEFLAPEDDEDLEPLPTNQLPCSDTISELLPGAVTQESHGDAPTETPDSSLGPTTPAPETSASPLNAPEENPQTFDISAVAEPDTPLACYGAHAWDFEDPELSDEDLRKHKSIARTVRFLARDLNALAPFRSPSDRRSLSAQLHAEYHTRHLAPKPDPLPCSVATRYGACLLS